MIISRTNTHFSERISQGLLDLTDSPKDDPSVFALPGPLLGTQEKLRGSTVECSQQQSPQNTRKTGNLEQNEGAIFFFF